jgi:hypothetical protein
LDADVATRWERVDERVLRWVSGIPSSLQPIVYSFEEREPVPDEDLTGLNSREVNDSLHRLLSHRLIYGRPRPGMQHTTWARLRITAYGLRVLGEWPDLDLVASAAALHHILRHLGEEAPEESKGPLVRAAGVVGRTADEIVRGTATDIARTIGKEVAGE